MLGASNRDDGIRNQSGSNLLPDMSGVVSDDAKRNRNAAGCLEFGEKDIEGACEDFTRFEAILESDEFIARRENRDRRLLEHLNFVNAERGQYPNVTRAQRRSPLQDELPTMHTLPGGGQIFIGSDGSFNLNERPRSSQGRVLLFDHCVCPGWQRCTRHDPNGEPWFHTPPAYRSSTNIFDHPEA